MSFEINSVPVVFDFREGVVSLTEKTGGDSGPEVTAILKCAWKDRFAVVKGLLGSTTIGTNNRISRIYPFHYPPSRNLFCTAISSIVGIKPRIDQTGQETGLKGWITYDEAVLTCVFTNPSWAGQEPDQSGAPETADASGLIFTTTRFKTNCEIFNPPLGAYWYTEGAYAGKLVKDSSVGQVRSRVEISMTRHYMPKVPLGVLMITQGYVNE